MSQGSVLGNKPIPDRKLARHIHMPVPILEQHANIFHRSDTSLDRSDAVLAVELVKLLPVRGYVIHRLLLLFRLARLGGLVRLSAAYTMCTRRVRSGLRYMRVRVERIVRWVLIVRRRGERDGRVTEMKGGRWGGIC